ncbi:ATP-binding cassette domain-containing protein [bacterium]|nr:MAG: ATP-binding cassette domain-containing protein [bacterium]
MLRVSDVWVTLGAIPILRGISLEVEPGRIVGLVGRNGAGKTTTIKSVLGLIGVHRGSIELEGRDLRAVPPYRRARLGIGYVHEDRRLLAGMSVEENILLPAWANRLRDERARLEAIYQQIPEVRALARREAIQLSGGQQKMVALARALMTGSKLLLLDEPFEGLAPVMAERLGALLRTLCARGYAMLIAESELKLIGRLADRIVTIERGEIVEGSR